MPRPASFAQQLQSARDEMFVCGYARQQIASSAHVLLFSFIPDTVACIILRYQGKQCCSRSVITAMYSVSCDADHCDRWDSQSLHYCCDIDADNNRIMYRGNDSEINPFSFGEHVVDMAQAHSIAMIWKIKVLRPHLLYIGIVEVTAEDSSTDIDHHDNTWCQLRDNAHILSLSDGQTYNGQRRKLQKQCTSPNKSEFIFVTLDSRFRSLSVFSMRWQLLCTMKNIKASKYKLAIGLSAKSSIELMSSYQTHYVQHDDLEMHEDNVNSIRIWLKWSNFVKTSMIVDRREAAESYKAILRHINKRCLQRWHRPHRSYRLEFYVQDQTVESAEMLDKVLADGMIISVPLNY